jgi:hypothetical protein
MKLIFTFLLFFFLVTTYAQELSSLSVTELKAKKSKAIQNEDYSLASKIKTELDFRTEIATKHSKLKAELKKAVAEEDYSKAADIKKKLEKYDRYSSIDSEIAKAVKAEEYNKAHELKIEKQQIRDYFQGKSIQKTDNKTPSSNSPSQKTTTQTPTNTSTTQPANDTENKTRKGNYFRPVANTSKSKKKRPSKKYDFWEKKELRAGVGLTIGKNKFTNAMGTVYKYDAKVGIFVEVTEVRHLFAIDGIADIDLDLNIGMNTVKFEIASPLNQFSLTYFNTGAVVAAKSHGGYFGLGYFLDFGLWGTQYQASSNKEYKVFELEAFQRYNMGIDWRIGYGINRFNLYMDYKIGLMNIEGKDSSNGQKSQLSILCFGVNAKF